MESYDYRDALEAAGATVLDFVRCGQWQGNWLAYVEYEGKKGFVSGYYGSCESCDEMLAFSADDGSREELAAIGKCHLDPLMSHWEASAVVGGWFEHDEAVDMLKKYAPPVGNC